MGAKRRDLTGQRFGRLLVLRDGGTVRVGKAQQAKRVWICRCDCGEEATVHHSSLYGGLTKSCGCLRRETTKAIMTVHGHTVGRSQTRAYRAWACMLTRVRNPNINSAESYSGRGIQVCPRWEDFENFLEDMGEPAAGQSLDRIDNDGDYSPENCRWATAKQQARNTSRTLRLTHNGRSQPLADWADELGLRYGTLYSRIRRGWSDAEAIEGRRHVVSRKPRA